METWHPAGVVAIISAFNFPAAVWAWNAALALVCGDAIVWKPSEKTPLTALACQSLLRRAMAEVGGIPEGLAQVVVGGADAGAALVSTRASPWCPRTAAPGWARRRAARRRRASPARSSSSAATMADRGTLGRLRSRPVRDRLFRVGTAASAALAAPADRARSIYDDLLARLAATYARLPIGNPLQPGTSWGTVDARAGDLMQGRSRGRGERCAHPWRQARRRQRLRGGLLPAPGPVEMPRRRRWCTPRPSPRSCTCCAIGHSTRPSRSNNAVPQGLSSSLFTTDCARWRPSCPRRQRLRHRQHHSCRRRGDRGASAAEGNRRRPRIRLRRVERLHAPATNTINYGRTLPLAQGIRFDVGPP